MNNRKPIRFVEPVVQRRAISAVLTCVGVTAVVAACSTIWVLHSLSTELGTDGQQVLDQAIPLGLRVGAVALAVSLPILVMMVLAATMPLIGVHYRMRVYLRAVEEGRETGPLTLRDTDPLQDIAVLVNATTAAHRNGASAATPEHPSAKPAEAA